MKKLFTLLLVVASLAVYSQISIPESSSKGTIVTQNNMTIQYRDLKYEKGKVTYKNAQTGIEEFLYDNSVKSIQENIQPEVSVTNENSVVTSSEEIKKEEKLTSVREIKDYLKQNNSSYRTAKTLSDVGTGLIAGGGAAFLIGGLSNVSKANESTATGTVKKGSSTPLICGIIAMAGGLVLMSSRSPRWFLPNWPVM
jgi:vacuolar-type H+-ATPase subunit I/STV1